MAAGDGVRCADIFSSAAADSKNMKKCEELKEGRGKGGMCYMKNVLHVLHEKT